jgi:mono/diheme cytochrome c family protein
MQINSRLRARADFTGRATRTPRSSTFIWLTVLCALPFVGPAWGAASPTSSDSFKVADVYRNSCSVCHGEKGDGQSRARNALNPPPRNFTSPEETAQLTRERMILSVTNGRPGTAMMPWKTRFSAQEIEALVDYVRTTFMKPAGTLVENKAAAAAVETKPPVSDSKAGPVTEQGRTLFVRNCAVCHGEKGDGQSRARNALNPPPRNFTSPEETAQLTRERMLHSITNGRPGTAMMPWKTRLSKAEIEAVADFIRGTFMPGTTGSAEVHADQPAAAAAAGAQLPQGAEAQGAAPAKQPAQAIVDMSLPFPNGLVGDAAKGKQFFNNNCATCHGVKGNGEGPRAFFNYPKPRNFLTPESHALFNRPTLFRSITNGKPGTVMPAWGKVLNDQEIANVAEHVFRQFISAQPKVGKK